MGWALTQMFSASSTSCQTSTMTSKGGGVASLGLSGLSLRLQHQDNRRYRGSHEENGNREARAA